MIRPVHTRRTPESGQVLPLFAISLIVLLAGLAVILDGGRVYAERRKTQNAADAAAMAGAAVLNKADPTGSRPAVLAAACRAAFVNGGFGNTLGTADNVLCGTNGSIVNVHIPASGDGMSALVNVSPVFEAPGYVQVSVESTFRPFMGALLGLSDFSASALGVAVNIAGNSIGDALLVLDPGECASLVFEGTNTLNVTGGNVTVNSDAKTSAGALCERKNAVVQSGVAGLNNIGGQNFVVGEADVNAALAPAFSTGVPYKPDPLTRVTVPPFDNTDLSPAGPGTWNVPQPWAAMGTAVAAPGVYWGGITVTSGDTLTLSGGTYIMAGGGFNVQGGTVTADAGVTIIYTVNPYCNSSVSAPPSGCNPPARRAGNLDGSHLNGSQSEVGQATGSWGTPGSALIAQTLSPDPYNLSDILIYVDRNALAQDSSTAPCPNTTLNVGGNGYFNFATGSIVYAPCSTVKLHGTSDPPSHAGAIVAWRVRISGTKNMDLGGPAPGGGQAAQAGLVQ